MKKYQSRTGRGRKSVAGERYNPEEDDLDEPIKVVPKSDEQRKRLQGVAQKIMLLNRLDEVGFIKSYVKLFDSAKNISLLMISLPSPI